MDCKQLLLKSFGRAQEILDGATADMTQAEFAWRAGLCANPPSFIIWHLSRVEDRLVNHTILNRPEVWTAGGWHKKLALPEDPAVTGFKYTSEQVAAFPRIDRELLLGYQRAVRQATLAYIEGLCDSDFECRVFSRHDEDNRVATLLGRTIVHVSQHSGQVDFIKGLLRSQRG